MPVIKKNDALKQLVKARGLTQYMIAKRLKVHPTTFSAFCSGLAPLPARYVGLIAKMLNLTPEALRECVTVIERE